MILTNKNKQKQQKFLQIVKHIPKRSTLDVDTDSKENFPLSEDAQLDPRKRDILMQFFDNIANREGTAKMIDADTPGLVPKFIYSNMFKMKTLYKSLFPGDLRGKAEVFICDLCLKGFSSKALFETHEVCHYS